MYNVPNTYYSPFDIILQDGTPYIVTLVRDGQIVHKTTVRKYIEYHYLITVDGETMTICDFIDKVENELISKHLRKDL